MVLGKAGAVSRKVGVVLGTVVGKAGDIKGGAGFPCSLLSPPPVELC